MPNPARGTKRPKVKINQTEIEELRIEELKTTTSI